MRNIRPLLILLFAFQFSLALAQDISLNSGWDFVKSEADLPNEIEGDWQLINIPHTWNSEDVYDDEKGYFRGTGWYKKDVYLPSTQDNQVFLKFEGANQTAEVFVNGKSAGLHIGGYSAFVIDITSLVKFDTENEIHVRLNNAHNPDIPPLSADFTFYGGIYRDVWLIRKPAVHFDLTDGSASGIYINQKTTESMAELSIRSKIRNKAGRGRYSMKWTLLDADQNTVAEKSDRVRLRNEKEDITGNLEISNPQLWSPERPYLYTLIVELRDSKGEDLLDRYIHKHGLRWFQLGKDGEFVLNGEVLKLIGANRHQDFAGMGNALPDERHRRDMEMLKEMGANFIRIAHYPQDPAILEACDELGLLAWEETPLVNYITVSEAHTRNSISMVQEMIRQHFNHTSVVMWGFMNEILLRDNIGMRENGDMPKEEYYPAVTKLATQLDSVCRSEDPSRLTTIAHHGSWSKYKEAGLNEITDVVGWNLYFGWYGRDNNWDGLGKYLDRFHENYAGTGLIVAEYGAGSDPRIHAYDPYIFDFSIEWQNLYHLHYLRQINERPFTTGATVWNFADFGSEHRIDVVPNINSKGLVNYDRSPKDAYLFYKAALKKEPYVAIGSLGWRVRQGFSASEMLNSPVYVFTNADELEVILNGEKQGSFPVKDFYAKLELPFKDGKNQLKVKAQGMEDQASFQVKIWPEDISQMSASDIDIAMNLGSHVHFTDAETDQIWIPEQEYAEGGFGYVGGKKLKTGHLPKVGTDAEIFGTKLEPLYQTHRDSIEAFKADVTRGWYEVELHFAEIYSAQEREKLAYNLGSDGSETEMDLNRVFEFRLNAGDPVRISNLPEFQAYSVKQRVLISGEEGLNIQFKAENGSAFLSGIKIRGL